MGYLAAMADDILFHKYDLRKVVENQRAGLHAELDSMSDDRLLTTDLAELQTYAAEKYRLDLPMLGEPVVDEGRTKIEVGRWGSFPRAGEPTVQVDAHRYTLEIPFQGDKELFFLSRLHVQHEPATRHRPGRITDDEYYRAGSVIRPT